MFVNNYLINRSQQTNTIQNLRRGVNTAIGFQSRQASLNKKDSRNESLN